MDVTFYGDFKRLETEIMDVVSLDEVAGEIACPDCGGTGDVSRYMPEPELGRVGCVTCKGSRLVLISL